MKANLRKKEKLEALKIQLICIENQKSAIVSLKQSFCLIVAMANVIESQALGTIKIKSLLNKK
jgi:hypothetical protein